MQIVSNGDNLHGMSYPVFSEKKIQDIINLSSDDFAKRLVKVKISFQIKAPFDLKIGCEHKI